MFYCSYCTGHRSNHLRLLWRLTIISHIKIGGFGPGAVARQRCGPDSNTVVSWGEPSQPAAPLQGKMLPGDTEVKLLGEERRWSVELCRETKKEALRVLLFLSIFICGQGGVVLLLS